MQGRYAKDHLNIINTNNVKGVGDFMETLHINLNLQTVINLWTLYLTYIYRKLLCMVLGTIL